MSHVSAVYRSPCTAVLVCSAQRGVVRAGQVSLAQSHRAHQEASRLADEAAERWQNDVGHVNKELMRGVDQLPIGSGCAERVHRPEEVWVQEQGWVSLSEQRLRRIAANRAVACAARV